ncbi:3'-5' exonuclease [Bacillus shivajii]|uniref:3'-5' exonuclease n=1 Tax=Bacillus shivajii TaxID=1983719 RepID=UPI001CF95616|nr:exonuclease domain-containing protein [Bacillus shivajii]UCZ51502.1 3'-5' exonuclease [Bacillus shivajii]
MGVSALRIMKFLLFDYHHFHYKRKQWLRKNQASFQEVKEAILHLNMRKSNIHVDTLLEDITYTVFDLETTGFYSKIADEVVSIGAIRINKNKIQFPEQYYEIVSPFKKVPNDVLDLTGLTVDEIEAGERFPIAMKNFLQFSEESVVVAHPSSFDVNFLKEQSKRWNLPPYNPIIVDSYEVAKYLYPDHRNDLDELVSRFAINGNDRHHALNDAHMTASLFEHLIEELNSRGIVTLRDWYEVKENRRG